MQSGSHRRRSCILGISVAVPSDSELLHRARQGDGTAFGALIRRHDKHLYRVARSVLDDQEAEDAVQESYVRAFTGLRDFRGASSLRTWLTRILLNEAFRRKRRRHIMLDISVLRAVQERTSRPIHSSLTAREPDPERAAAQAQIRKILENAVDNLPSAFRIVFVMRDVEELSLKETAVLLGIREETVKTRLLRARRMLRESLGGNLAIALKGIFPFEKPRCNALVQRLLNQLSVSPAGHRS
jgi:RNA polymerase sigma-70 factor (ECF subfamily)